MRRQRFLLRHAVHPTSRILHDLQNGLGAVASRDLELIHLDDRTIVGDSINLDEHQRSSLPNAARWDYILSIPSSRHIVGLEPHAARDGEISVVIRKRKTALDYLDRELRAPHRVAYWIWVTRGSVGFSNNEKARRILDQNGIFFAGRIARMQFK